MAVFRVALDLPLLKLFDYVAPGGSAAHIGRRVLVPFGRGRKVGIVVEVEAGSTLPSERLREIVAILEDIPSLPADWLALTRFCSTYYHAAHGEVMAAALPPRLRDATPLPAKPAAHMLALTEAGRAALPELSPRRRAHRLLARLASQGAIDRASLVRGVRGAAQVVAQLEAHAWVAPMPVAAAAIGGEPPGLLVEQRQAIDAINATQGFGCHLLHGVTGSGKTEIYLRLVGQTLSRNRQALVLAPEIGLTPQIDARLRARFPHARIVAMHSGVADGERAQAFAAALRGEADVVVGTRLAVFTPMPRLGLIVVDEEHDPSFKQQDGVRYNARDLAVWRAKQCALPIVLGSATPSLESWQHACAGRYTQLTLAQRALAASLPAVRCLDVRGERLQEGISARLLAAFEQCLARGEQSMLFINRRGYAPTLACDNCGWVSACSHCSANLVVHLADGRLRCHHCGASAPVPRCCPDCGNQDVLPVGRGTQRMESVLAASFPNARVLRVDRDSAGSPRRWRDLIETIRSGAADILVGTQMLAKGHDFPRLTLVGVLNADASLHAADFRAQERLFAQLMQVGGRSGRAELAGEVLVQTAFPQHPLYRALAAHDFTGFANAELAQRKAAGLPPCAYHALLRGEARRMDDSLDFLGRAARLAASLARNVAIYDPVPMRLARRADLERGQLLVEATRRDQLHEFLDAWLALLREEKCPRDLRWHLDVDPLEL